MNKLLIIGLGNPGADYDDTRHNIGFRILDSLAARLKAPFYLSRLAHTAVGKIKNKEFFLVKPTTFMNLSGKAVNYYLQQEKVPLNNLLVVTDDIALPLGTLRLRSKGSDGGHNGLKSINEVLGNSNYARLRFGIGNDFPKGSQSDYVLGKWSSSDEATLVDRVSLAVDSILDFGMMGVEKAMNLHNNK